VGAGRAPSRTVFTQARLYTQACGSTAASRPANAPAGVAIRSVHSKCACAILLMFEGWVVTSGLGDSGCVSAPPLARPPARHSARTSS
jgi:hypothetical protein